MQVSTWQDTSVQPGEDVCYVVRTVHATDPLLESGPSAESCVKVRDISPPQAPLGLSVLEADGAAELSWSPSPEADLALYRVYKAARGGEPAKLAEVKAGETAYRDPAPRSGAVVYTLTAVDKAGNESPPSSSALLR
jgi:fibronectin type 3 domain-containing protein